jgi:DnaJ-domain-containing protein 1
MDPFWLINQASLKGVREAQPRAAAPQPSGAENGASFLAQVEQVLGVETEPDAEFFVDSWTVGVAAASESFLRRQELKRREHQIPAWDTFSSFTPWFVSNVEASSGAAWSPGEQRLMADLLWVDDEDEVDGQAAEEAIEGPLTLESARRLLGVAATSTREQIRVAYRKMASRYHPDRLARATAQEQELANDRMARINAAHRLLCMDLAGRRKDRCIM